MQGNGGRDRVMLGNGGREGVCQEQGVRQEGPTEHKYSAGPLEKKQKKIKYFHFSIDILLYKVVYYKHTKERRKTK